jgi:amidase
VHAEKILKTNRRAMTMRMRWLIVMAIVVAAMWPCGASAAEIAGKWVAEVSGPMLLEPVFARVTLESTGDTLSGTWGSNTVKGSFKGSQLVLTVTDTDGAAAGELTGKVEGAEGTGSGTLGGLGRRPGGAMGAGARTPMPQEVTWKLTREVVSPAKPREINYEPKTFQAYYYAGNKPDIHIFPGDIVHTWSVDSAGVDKNGRRLALGGNANIGPIYVEGALPGRYAGCSPDQDRTEPEDCAARKPNPTVWSDPCLQSGREI